MLENKEKNPTSSGLVGPDYGQVNGQKRKMLKTIGRTAVAVCLICCLPFFAGCGGSAADDDTTIEVENDTTTIIDDTITEDENDTTAIIDDTTTEDENNNAITGNGGVLRTSLPNGGITEIYFLDTLADAPDDAEDVSEARDDSVLCWTEDTVSTLLGTAAW